MFFWRWNRFKVYSKKMSNAINCPTKTSMVHQPSKGTNHLLLSLKIGHRMSSNHSKHCKLFSYIYDWPLNVLYHIKGSLLTTWKTSKIIFVKSLQINSNFNLQSDLLNWPCLADLNVLVQDSFVFWGN